MHSKLETSKLSLYSQQERTALYRIVKPCIVKAIHQVSDWHAKILRFCYKGFLYKQIGVEIGTNFKLEIGTDSTHCSSSVELRPSSSRKNFDSFLMRSLVDEGIRDIVSLNSLNFSFRRISVLWKAIETYLITGTKKRSPSYIMSKVYWQVFSKRAFASIIKV